MTVLHVPPPLHARVGEGNRVRVPGMHRATTGLPVYYLISLVVGGIEAGPPLGDLGRALYNNSLLILRFDLGLPLGCRTQGLSSSNEKGGLSFTARVGTNQIWGRARIEPGEGAPIGSTPDPGLPP